MGIKRGGYSSPRSSRRGCLCKDGKTYSRKCCNGELINQGIGSITGTSLTKESVVLTGLSVASTGVITPPTATYEGQSLGTVTISPESFPTVSVDTEREVESTIVVPEKLGDIEFSNPGVLVQKPETVTQTPITGFSCSDLGTASFFIGPGGNYSISFSSGAVVTASSPASFASNTTLADVQRSLTVTITAPAGYTNSGSTIGDCIVTGYQPSYTKIWQTDNLSLTGTRTWRFTIKGSNVPDTSAQTVDYAVKGPVVYLGYAAPTVVSGDSGGTISSTDAIYATVGAFSGSSSSLKFKSDTPFSSLQTENPNVNLTYTVFFTGTNTGNSAFSSAAIGFDAYITEQIGSSNYLKNDTTVSIQSSSEKGYNIASNLYQNKLEDGYYTGTNVNKQIRVQSGVITEFSTII